MKIFKLILIFSFIIICNNVMADIVAPHNSKSGGGQVLHFDSSNRPHKDKKILNFIKNNFYDAKAVNTDAGILKYANEQVTIEGLFLEFGVCTGRTTNFIAALNPLKTIHGFDSFKGLPEDWNKGVSKGRKEIMKKGTFAFTDPDKLLGFLHNIKLYKGLFNDTLPLFTKHNNDKTIAFLHIDSDLYSSAKSVFDNLGNMIKPGTIIVFDEYYGYPAFLDHEYKAFQEFIMLREDLDFKYLAYNPMHEQVVVKIIKKDR